jgi:hypothetical protein
MSTRASEIAEAILIVVKRLLKWFAISIGTLIVLGCIIAASYWGWNYFTYDLPKSKIEIVTSVNDERCAGEHPVFVGIVNNSDRTVMNTRIRLQAFIPGRSTNVATWNWMSDDRIIKPGKGFGQCWRPVLDSDMPKNTDLKTLEWSVATYEVDFE